MGRRHRNCPVNPEVVVNKTATESVVVVNKTATESVVVVNKTATESVVVVNKTATESVVLRPNGSPGCENNPTSKENAKVLCSFRPLRQVPIA